MTLEQALARHLEQSPEIELGHVDCVTVEGVGVEGVLGPGLIQVSALCTVAFTSRWKTDQAKELQHQGYLRAVELLRQTGRDELAGELERAWK